MNKILILIVAVVLVALFILRQLGQARPADVRALLRKGGRVIDVRTAQEFAAGHLDGVVNIPLDQLATRAPREFPDRAAPLLLHCASGARSAAGVDVLRKLGYTSVINVGSYRRAAHLTLP